MQEESTEATEEEVESQEDLLDKLTGNVDEDEEETQDEPKPAETTP